MEKSQFTSLGDRAIGFALVATVVILPLLLISTGDSAFRFPKILLVRVAATLLLGIAVLRRLWGSHLVEWRRLRNDHVLLLVVFILIWTLLSMLFSGDRVSSFWALWDVFAAFALFILARGHARRTGSTMVLCTSLIPAIVMLVVLVMQAANLWHPMVSPEELETLRRQDRVIVQKAALLGNRNDVGLYLLLPFSFALGLVGRYPVRGGIAIVLVLGAIVLSTTLTSTVIASALLFYRLLSLRWKRRSHILGLAGIAAVCLVLILSVLMQADMQRRMQIYAQAIRERNVSGIISGRMIAFSAASQMIRENPIMGVGPGRFPLEYTEKAHPIIEQSPFREDREWEYFDMVHNDYLEIAAEAGLPALIAGIALLVIHVRTIYRGAGSGSKKEAVAADTGVFSAIAISLGAVSLFPLQLAAVYGTFAIVSGVSLGHAERIENRL